MALGVQILAAGATTRKTAQLRQLAFVEVGNLAERIRAAGTEVTDDQTAAWIRESTLHTQIPNATLSATLQETAGPPQGKVAIIECRWHDRRGVDQPPLRVALVLYAKAQRVGD